MKDWIRRLPHPTYGNYGGRLARCISHNKDSCPFPIDWMDQAFMKHDIDLRAADKLDPETDANLIEFKKRQADKDLYKHLKRGNPRSLSLYGKLYRRACLIIFK